MARKLRRIPKKTNKETTKTATKEKVTKFEVAPVVEEVKSKEELQNSIQESNQCLQIFDNPEFGQLRSLIVDGEPYFVGKDIAEALGYSNSSKAVINHVDSEDKVTKTIAYSQNGKTVGKLTLINESGLYSLILSSKLPSAKQFKRWVTSEVLPQIRKTGGYIPIQEADDDMTILSKAFLIAQKTIQEQQSIIESQKNMLILQKDLLIQNRRQIFQLEITQKFYIVKKSIWEETNYLLG